MINDDVYVPGKRTQRFRRQGNSGGTGGFNATMKSFKQALQVAPEKLIPIGDIVFDNVTMREAVDRVVEMAHKKDRARYVCTANLDHLAMCETDDSFREIYRRADMVLADGMPVVWLSQPHVMGSLSARVAGSDLFWEVAKVSAKNNLRLFFMGGSPGSADLAAEAIKGMYPGAQVVGTYCPAFETFNTDEEQERIRTAIRDTNPDVLMVGLGAPKQEKWISANKDLIGVPVSIGVGGSFEMAGGVVRRAPVWMQKTGLEWSYRLLQEPRRLWNRYVQRDIPYLLGLAPGAARMARFRVGTALQTMKDDKAAAEE